MTVYQQHSNELVDVVARYIRIGEKLPTLSPIG